MNIYDALKNNKTLVSSHRGKSGGNVIENTVSAAKCAMLSGADIVEFDVARTLDGNNVILHTGMESRLFGFPLVTKTLTLSFIKKLKCLNAIKDMSGRSLNSLEEYLDELKGKCFLNLDRIWHGNMEKAVACVAERDMFDQVIFKSAPNGDGERLISLLSSYKNAFYMAICRNRKELEKAEALCEKYKLKLSAAEVIFTDESDYFCSDAFFAKAKEKDLILWVNAIVLNSRPDMCAGHGDDFSIEISRDKGWGWLIDKGYDIIQTDWPCLLSNYIKSQKSEMKK